jgi:drug/metabolite transporter (DMT)-like permease
LLSLPQDGRFALSDGALLIAAACLCWGIDNNLTRKISGSDPSQIAMWKGLAAGAVNTGLALATGAKLPTMSIILAVAAIGFLSYGVLVLFVRALLHLGTARTETYFSTAPFAGTALAFATGQGRLDWAFCAAGVLMLIGVWLHVTSDTNTNTSMSRWNTNISTTTTSTTSTSTLKANLMPIGTDTRG